MSTPKALIYSNTLCRILFDLVGNEFRGLAGWIVIWTASIIALANVAGPAHGAPTEVRLGVVLTSIHDIEPRDGSFAVSGYAWFVDPSGTFDPLREVEIIARSAEIQPLAEADLPDGAHYTAISFSATIDHEFDVRRYPFDRQSLVFIIESERSTETYLFTPDSKDSTLHPSVRAPGWRILDISLKSSVQAYDTGFGYKEGDSEFSQIIAKVNIERKISPFLFEKFTGFFVAFAITALVIFVPVDELGTRIGMTTGSVFAAVFNRYRLEDATGFDAVFGTVDQVTMLTFGAIIAILVLSIYAHRMFRDGRDDAATRINFIAGSLVLVTHAILIMVVFWIALG